MQKRLFHPYLFLSIAMVIISLWLRLFYVDHTPPALHGDELGVGYNAYTLLKTGRDEYEKLLPITFRHDFNPVIFYATVPFIFLLGLNEYATRLPSVVIGIFIILSIYPIVTLLFHNRKLSLLTMFFLSLSTWHIRTSRLAVEMIWALFFQMMALAFFLKGVRSKKTYLVLSFLCFTLSLFSYQSTKMTTPLLVVGLLILYWNSLRKNIKLVFLLFFLCIILPTVGYFLIRPIQETRFAGISVFAEWKVSHFPTFYTLGKMVIDNYLKHFHPSILFLDNSTLRYYQTANIGLFYRWQSIFIIFGLFHSLRNWKRKEYQLLLFWIFLSPLPASLTTGVPNANVSRNLMMVPMVELLCAQGLLFSQQLLRKTKHLYFFVLVSIVSIVGVQLASFLFSYFVTMPTTFATFWGEPLKKAILTTRAYENGSDKIIISKASQQSYMYYLFYRNISPEWFFKQKKERNKGIGYSKIGKYEFVSSLPEDTLIHFE